MQDVKHKPTAVFEQPTDKLVAVGSYYGRITNGLAASRVNIKKWSDEIADLELKAADIQDTLNDMYSAAFVEAATAVNKETGKLQNPNLDSQRAATTVELCDSSDYVRTRSEHRNLLREIQIKKNSMTCEHERRGDLRSEIDLLRLLTVDHD